MNNEGQVIFRWPNYVIDGLFTFCCWKTEIAKDKSIPLLKYMKVTYEYLFEYIYIDYNMLRAWYRFYSRAFNTISQTSEFMSEWAIWY